MQISQAATLSSIGEEIIAFRRINSYKNMLKEYTEAMNNPERLVQFDSVISASRLRNVDAGLDSRNVMLQIRTRTGADISHLSKVKKTH